MPIPSLDEIAVQALAGAAIVIIVEGEDRGGDAFVYGDIWFGDRAPEIRFFPQDGWPQVRQAVETLRNRLPGDPIFGLIDRDFTADADLRSLEPIGVFRSPRYSVENYLLDAGCWHRTFSLLLRPRMDPDPQWASAPLIEARIQDAYDSARPAAAFNRTIAQTIRTHPGCKPISYVQHVDDERLLNPGWHLEHWSQQIGCRTNLVDDLNRNCAELDAMGSEELATQVNGKMVLDAFLRKFQACHPPLNGFRDWQFVNHYLGQCSSPPDQIRELIGRIEDTAAAMRRRW